MYCPSNNSSDPTSMEMICCLQQNYSNNSAYGIPDYEEVPGRRPRRNYTSPTPTTYRLECKLASVVPSSPTSASGYAWFDADVAQNTLKAHIFVENLRGVQSVQLRMRGTNEIVMPLLLVSIPMGLQIPLRGYLINHQTYTPQDLMGSMYGRRIADLVRSVQQGMVYLSIQTVFVPTGELIGVLSSNFPTGVYVN